MKYIEPNKTLFVWESSKTEEKQPNEAVAKKNFASSFIAHIYNDFHDADITDWIMVKAFRLLINKEVSNVNSK